MKAKEMAVSAVEMVGSRVVQKGATKAIQSLPKQKQNKVKGMLMVAAAMFLLVSALKMYKKE